MKIQDIVKQLNAKDVEWAKKTIITCCDLEIDDEPIYLAQLILAGAYMADELGIPLGRHKRSKLQEQRLEMDEMLNDILLGKR